MKQYLSDKGQVVGEMREGIYRKKVKGSRHLYKVMDAWGIDFSIVEQLLKDGCQEIRVLDTDENKVYTITLDDFCARAVERNHGTRQLLLPRKYWECHVHQS